MSWQSLPTAIRDRLMKLLALAERGIGGEAQTAQVLLEKLLAECGLAMSDLEAVGAAEWYVFEFSGYHDAQLLLQVVRRIVNKFEILQGMVHKEEGGDLDNLKVAYMLTQAQAAEVSVTFSVYRRALHAEFEAMLSAFLHVNDVFCDEQKKMKPETSRSPEDEEKMARAIDLALGMNPTNVNQQLGDKSGGKPVDNRVDKMGKTRGAKTIH